MSQPTSFTKLIPPSTMKAWQFTSTSPNLQSNLHLNPSAPLPQPTPSQHLIQILATALNPVDYKLCEIPLLMRFKVSKPATPCVDFCGRIVTPASGSSLKAGDLVFGVSGSSPIAGGALRQYNVATEETIARLPEGLDPVLAAGIGVTGWTAYQSIFPRLKKGERVLILGGSGGTGVLGIQIAKKIIGAHVTTSCSGRNEALVRELGADEVIDYTKGSVLGQLREKKWKFDLVIDNVGTDEELVWKSAEFLNKSGVYVKVSSDLTFKSALAGFKRAFVPGVLGGLKHKVENFWPQPKPEQLSEIAVLIRDGKFKMMVDEVFAFEDAPKAFEKLKTGRARGKIVVDVASKTYMEDLKST